MVTGQFAIATDIISSRAVIERLKQMIPHATIAGVEFRTLPAALLSSRVATKEAELKIEGFVGSSVVRIAGLLWSLRRPQ